MKSIEQYSKKSTDPRQLSFNFGRKLTILALGHKARQGKDECAQTICSEYEYEYDIAIIGFAEALRNEITSDMKQIQTEQGCSPQEALAVLCLLEGVEYDPDAKEDELYPHGKQRALLQARGQHRREEDPDYWVNQWWASVLHRAPHVVIVPDMRYPNELAFVKARGGYTVKVVRKGFSGLTPEQATHISETALNGAKFDYLIQVKDGQLDLLRHKALNTFENIMEKETN